MSMHRAAARFAALAAFMLVFVPLAYAQQSAPLQERMSYTAFKKAGLDKLSPEQLKALNTWLQAHGCDGASMGSSASSAQAAPATHPQAHARDGKITSRIAGDFHGWDNGTVLTLQNGQRWQVTDDSGFTIKTIHNPQVTLTRGFFGSWILSVKGVDPVAHVTPAR